MDKTNSSLVLIQLIDCFFYLGLDIERNSRYAENKFVVWMAKEIRGKVLFIELIRFSSIQICEKQIHGLISKEIDDDISWKDISPIAKDLLIAPGKIILTVDKYMTKIELDNNKPCIVCVNDKEGDIILSSDTDNYWKTN
ncbi:unnamed protein product, partial [Rotaria magnacalcarata]